MRASRSVLFAKAGFRALLAAVALAAGALTAGQPGSDIRTLAQRVYGGGATLVAPDVLGLPRVPNMLDLIDLVAQNPEVVAEASRLGLRVADGAADGLDYVQDTKIFKILNVGADGIGQLNDFIEAALKKGEKLAELLEANKDKIQNYSKKLKILDWALKGIKIAHLSGHVIESLYNKDRAGFSEALNELVKGGLKMGSGMGGAAAGTALGTFIGGFFGGVGAIPGAVIGGVIGGWLGGEAGEAGAEYVNDNYLKDGTKGTARDLYDWLFGPQAPPALPPPLPGGTGGGAGSPYRPRPPPKLNRF